MRLEPCKPLVSTQKLKRFAHCTRGLCSASVFKEKKPVNKGVAIISSFTFARLAWAVCRFSFGLQCNWREGLTIIMERGSGSVPLAWREGLAAHVLSRLRAARLEWCEKAIFF